MYSSPPHGACASLGPSMAPSTMRLKQSCIHLSLKIFKIFCTIFDNLVHPISEQFHPCYNFLPNSTLPPFQNFDCQILNLILIKYSSMRVVGTLYPHTCGKTFEQSHILCENELKDFLCLVVIFTAKFPPRKKLQKFYDLCKNEIYPLCFICVYVGKFLCRLKTSANGICATSCRSATSVPPSPLAPWMFKTQSLNHPNFLGDSSWLLQPWTL